MFFNLGGFQWSPTLFDSEKRHLRPPAALDGRLSLRTVPGASASAADGDALPGVTPEMMP